MARVLSRLLLAGLFAWAGWRLAIVARDAYDYHGGRFFDETGRYGRAVPALERSLRRRPADPRACRTHLRLGRIYARRFERCLEARRHFESAAREFPDDKVCALEARTEIINCPDFFPLERGRAWVYGDTASGGRNMRLEVEGLVSKEGQPLLQNSLFAGNKRISVFRKQYVKKDWAVWELDAGRETAVLRYPFRAGNSWSVARGQKETLSYSIEADDVEVKTKAGTFFGCIKVRELDSRVRRAWKYDYYAPGVGRVKTTVGAPGVESPNTELITYR